MGLRTKVVYTAKPYAGNVRCHRVPPEAVKAALNDPEALPSSLQIRQCLVQIMIVDQQRLVVCFPPTVMHTTPDNELVCSAEQFPQYPAHLSSSAVIVVELVVID